MDQLLRPLSNLQAADAGARGLLQPTPEDLSSLVGGWSGPRPLRVCSGGTSSRAAAAGQWTLDLRRTMGQVTWNPADQTVSIGGGCRMGEVLEQLSPGTQRGRRSFGLARCRLCADRGNGAVQP